MMRPTIDVRTLFAAPRPTEERMCLECCGEMQITSVSTAHWLDRKFIEVEWRCRNERCDTTNYEFRQSNACLM